MFVVTTKAITIHKSQSKTLSSAYMTLDETVRSEGQGYVAVSRVRTLGGVWIEKVVRKAFRADPEALHYDDFLRTRELPKLPDVIHPRMSTSTPDKPFSSSSSSRGRGRGYGTFSR